MANVVLQNVSKIYDKNVKAVNNISLEVREGEFAVLVGPSGCGKSTLLRMIAGLEEISEGNIFIDGKKVNNVQPKDRDIAMVFQNYALYPHMTVFENMAFGLKLRKYPKEEIQTRVIKAAELLELSEYLNRKPKALSGGQRQRVAVGRSIVRKPKVFLFDEPLSNLDAKLRVQMRIEITKLHQQLEATMIYVTHDQVEAMTMGDRIVVLDKGIIQQYDTPLNVYNDPSNAFVAGFIGSPSMNFINGEIFRKNSELIFQSENFNLTLDQNINLNLENNQKMDIILGIRPEHIKISEDQKTDFHTIVDVVEPMGNEIFVYLKLGNQQIIMRSTQHLNLKPKQGVDLVIDQTKIHLFNRKDGSRIYRCSN